MDLENQTASFRNLGINQFNLVAISSHLAIQIDEFGDQAVPRDIDQFIASMDHDNPPGITIYKVGTEKEADNRHGLSYPTEICGSRPPETELPCLMQAIGEGSDSYKGADAEITDEPDPRNDNRGDAGALKMDTFGDAHAAPVCSTGKERGSSRVTRKGFWELHLETEETFKEKKIIREPGPE